jgi:large-conductance mechanosensitive channel
MKKLIVDKITTSNIKSFISRRDFLKLKSLLMLWYYFFQSFGINLFVSDDENKIDYKLLDKLIELPFSAEVIDEIKLRVDLQNRYNTDANGNIVSLNRFIKEIINFIISKKIFSDFKLLNSIKDKQIDYSYMLNATAKHNEVNSMQYLQQKIISYKDDTMLNNALEYAIKSQSFDTTLYLMQQNIKLDSNSQKQLLKVLHKEHINKILYSGKKIDTYDFINIDML